MLIVKWEIECDRYPYSKTSNNSDNVYNLIKKSVYGS